jgi:hypothetical protein
MSWAALNEQLRALLPRFSLPADSKAADDLSEQLHALGRPNGLLCTLEREVELPEAEAEALRRTVCEAAEQLSLLESNIQGDTIDEATAQLVFAACQLIGTCTRIACNARVPERFLSCARFLLRCGAATQQCVVRQVHCGDKDEEDLFDVLLAQVWALDLWQTLVDSLLDAPDPAAVAEQCAPPVLLLQWLQHTLCSLQLIAPTSWRPGEPQVPLMAGGQLGCLQAPPSHAWMACAMQDTFD